MTYRRDNRQPSGQGTDQRRSSLHLSQPKSEMEANSRDNWNRIFLFSLFDIAGAWSTSRLRSVFRIGRSALSLAQTNESARGRTKKKKINGQTSTQFAAVQERGGWIFIFVATLSMLVSVKWQDKD